MVATLAKGYILPVCGLIVAFQAINTIIRLRPAFETKLNEMRMRITLLFFLFAASTVVAQKKFKNNCLYTEIMGNGIVLSVNYELQTGKEPGFGIHAGIGLGGSKPAFPIGVRYLINISKQKSFVEAGTGITFAEKDVWIDKTDYNNANPYRVAFISSLSYRHHTTYGLMWKLTYSPIFCKDRTELFFGGVSVGWRF